jgi:hypothetical protein
MDSKRAIGGHLRLDFRYCDLGCFLYFDDFLV